MTSLQKSKASNVMKIAVEGCCHGELDAIYHHIQQLEKKNNYKVDALLICGDFQAMRNHRDLQCMACPNKYKHLQHFYKYYTGERKAPVLTLVIGGNHEASNYMWELYHGGWLAPNIYFLGHAGSVRLNGVPIAGASGIFKANDFRLGHYERVPYDASAMRSIYHIREYSVRKLSLLSSNRIFLSHDWPQSIEHYGDLNGLLHRKSFLRGDIEKGALGSPPLMGLLHTLKPEWWFAAHLHTRYEAKVVHETETQTQPPAQTQAKAQAAPVQRNPDEILIEDDDDDEEEQEGKEHARPASVSVSVPQEDGEARNPDEIQLDDEEENVEMAPPPPKLSPAEETRFLALDKCLPRRQFLEVVDISIPEPVPKDGSEEADTETDTETENKPEPDPQSQSHSHSESDTDANSEHTALRLSFDAEWLAITRAFHPWLSTTRHQRSFPEEAEARGMVAKELEWVRENVPTDRWGEIPVLDHQQFVMTAPGPGTEGEDKFKQPPWYTNPQTEAFCRMLDIPNKINPPPTTSGAGAGAGAGSGAGSG